ncbi:secretory phospholipase A2 receptor [Biomphalaria pfeifferi]|uniref:Secretory phospholipase A2 receptor n=1 Tax=Biomphalaria pfeifferi TaxID=112525 RepID=A0AAD8C8K5_BIOPF|nr:secretory phospholipase A2 receptor [Biomphalaria pfeifferi]
MLSNVLIRFGPLLMLLGAVCRHCIVTAGRFDGCGQGWINYKDSCYLLAQSNITWSEARSKCLQESAELTSIHSLEENEFITSLLPNNYKFWIGLESLMSKKDHRWTDNSSINVFGFDVWSKILWKLSPGLCVYIESKTGYWKTSGCQYISDSGYICKRHKYNEPVDTQTKYSVICTKGSPRTCCTLYKERKPWEEAQRFCKEQNQKLVTITDRPTLVHLMTNVEADSMSIWTGLEFYNDSFLMNSRKIQDPYPWISGEHRKLTISGCVALKSFVWETQDCKTSLPFLCEERQYTSSDITALRMSTNTVTPSLLSTDFIQGLKPLLDTTTKQILPDADKDNAVELEKVYFKSSAIRKDRSLVLGSCLFGWVQRNNYCYKVITTKESWHGARQHCESLGANLPSIHSKAENDILISLMKQDSLWGLWIGLHDSSKETKFEWTDRTLLDFTFWSQNEPNGLTVSEDCVELRLDGDWNDNNCNTIRPYVCVAKLGSTFIPTLIITTEAPRCAEKDWLYHGGFCYYVSIDQKTWSQSQDVCRNKGAELISLHSEDENNFLLYQLSKRDIGDHTLYWLGLNTLNQSYYKWSDGSPVDYVAWQGGIEPKTVTNKCVITKTEHVLWSTSVCHSLYRYICKVQMNSLGRISTTEQIKFVCPEGFTGREESDRCFYIGGLGNQAGLTWYDAKEACREMSSQTVVQIASIRDAKEQAFLNLLMDGYAVNAWIGLEFVSSQVPRFWEDDSPVTYGNWPKIHKLLNNELFKTNYQRDYCVYFLGEISFAMFGEWILGHCDSKKAYICQTNKVPRPYREDTRSKFPYTPTTATKVPKSTYNTEKCPEKFQKFHTFCYLVVSQLETWDEARTSCRARGADLAKMEHILQLSKMTLLLADYGVKKPAWIGIKQVSGSRFEWTDQAQVRKFFWTDDKVLNETANNTKPFCVSLSASGWISSDCREKLPYICQTKLEVRPTATVPLHYNQTLCKDGKSVQHGDYCYLMRKDQVSWPEADHVCKQLGMQLVSIRSNSEVEFLVNETQQMFENLYYWIGLVSYENGSFHWNDGSFMTYTNWAEDTPVMLDSPEEMCVVMDSYKGRWHPVDCLTELPGYICSSYSKNVGMLSSHISGGLIAAIVMAALFACCLILMTTVLVIRKRRRLSRFDHPWHRNGDSSANAAYDCSNLCDDRDIVVCNVDTNMYVTYK